MKVDMSLRERMDKESGVVTFKIVEHPILGNVRIRSLNERQWQNDVHKWFYRHETDWSRIQERTIYDNVKLIQMCLVEEDADTLVYTDSFADLDKLVDMREQITKPLFDACREFNRPDLAKN